MLRQLFIETGIWLWAQHKHDNCSHSFKNLYSASSSPLLFRGASDSSMVKKNSFKTIIECVGKRPR